MNEGWSGVVLLAWGFVCFSGRHFTLEVVVHGVHLNIARNCKLFLSPQPFHKLY